MSNQYVTSKFPTLEGLALGKVCQQFPALRRRGFSMAVRRACNNELIPKRVPIIPDGWLVEGDHINGEGAICIEIEDRHPLSAEKLWLYCDLADTLDFHGHYPRLFVFDRYGLNRRELNLTRLYIRGLVQMHGPAKPT
jgi:hypothetical protein